MRSLFHFPFPAQPPSQQPSPTATVSLQSEMCHRPHPAPMRRQRRSPVLLSAARPLPGRPPCRAPSLPRAAARPTRPTIPRAPRPRIRPTARAQPCAHCASITYALLPAARVPLYRHRADPESSSRSLPSGSPARLARIAPTARRHPVTPHLSSRCGGPRALAGKNRAVCIPFSPNALKRPPSWQHPPEMHAFRDQDGNILAPCIHFRAQSGDSGCMARESCRQGPFFASRNPKSRMARRCCQRRPAFLRQRHAAWPNGLCAMRQRHAARGMAERALRPAARAWPACRMRPLPSRPRSSPPSYTRRASPPASRPPRAAIRRTAHCGRGERRSGSSCRPRAAHADASRYLRAAPIPPAERTHRVQETSGATQATQCEHKNRIPKWGPY